MWVFIGLISLVGFYGDRKEIMPLCEIDLTSVNLSIDSHWATEPQSLSNQFLLYFPCAPVSPCEIGSFFVSLCEIK